MGNDIGLGVLFKHVYFEFFFNLRKQLSNQSL